jgi:hypothetical protein
LEIPTWQKAYESFALFITGSAGSILFFVGFLSLVFTSVMTKGRAVFGIPLGRLAIYWFFGFIFLNLFGILLGWGKLSERRRLKKKLKPIPPRGEKIEIYDVETGKPLANISQAELTYLIDSFREWGMEDNDFYILRETVDLFEQSGAPGHLVALLRELMGKKNDLEIGWTLV